MVMGMTQLVRVMPVGADLVVGVIGLVGDVLPAQLDEHVSRMVDVGARVAIPVATPELGAEGAAALHQSLGVLPQPCDLGLQVADAVGCFGQLPSAFGIESVLQRVHVDAGHVGGSYTVGVW
jgi:hypothetical protein